MINKEIRLNKYTVQINYKISSNTHFNALMLNLQGVFTSKNITLPEFPSLIAIKISYYASGGCLHEANVGFCVCESECMFTLGLLVKKPINYPPTQGREE